MPPKINFDNTYLKLPNDFYQHINPSKVSKPVLIKYNNSLSKELGFSGEEISREEQAEVFSGNVLITGSQPIAQVYAGHQFGHFTPRLGDGRAILLGEVVDINGERKDIQLKGSGRTQFSRGGDGRAPLRAVIREYIMSEAMYALGISTTRSLSIVGTGDIIHRETLLPSAVLCRVASSHIRIGTFEYFVRRGEYDSLKKLLDYTIERHYPEVQEKKNPYLSFFEGVLDRQASLIASWMNIGFIHGVMNTDNTTISGETIDYGPCAFMDTYDKNTVFSSIDTAGRYAFTNQKNIIQWNLARLGECLIPFIDKNEKVSVNLLEKSLGNFQKIFKNYWLEGMRKKIGFFDSNDENLSLIEELLDILEENKVDYTLFFRYLCDIVEAKDYEKIQKLFLKKEKIDTWLEVWSKKIKRQNITLAQIATKMKEVNPAFIPRNHRVEQVINEAVTKNDFTGMNRLLKILERPFLEQSKDIECMNPPKENERVYQTFCGT